MHFATRYLDFRILFSPLFAHEIPNWVYNYRFSLRTEFAGPIVNHVLNKSGFRSFLQAASWFSWLIESSLPPAKSFSSAARSSSYLTLSQNDSTSHTDADRNCSRFLQYFFLLNRRIHARILRQ